MKRLAPICASAVALLMAGGAAAQSTCGETYEIRSGDTLYSVSQRCRVTLARIMDLNPRLGDPRDISVGTEIRLEPRDDDDGERAGRDGDGQRAGDSGRPHAYRVQQGDTLYSIAQTLGVSLMELISENPDLDPLAIAVGELLDVPGDDPGGTVSVSPSSGASGDSVRVRARGLRPNDWVTIGVGRWASEWEPLREVQTGSDGRLSARVTVPDWADPGADLIFVVDTDRGVTLKSDVFDVVEAEEDERTVLEGRIRQGTECHTITTPAGETWSVVSQDVRFTPGEYVEITGRRAEASFCMEGRGTIEVSEIREVQPPPSERPDDGDRARLSEDFLAGQWVSETGSCRNPDFRIERTSAGGLVVRTTLNERQRTAYVRPGQDARIIFDQPRRDLPLQRRGSDALAVLPPDEGSVDLAGRRISGQGRVFVRCG